MSTSRLPMIVTGPQLCELLQIGPGTLYEWRRQGMPIIFISYKHLRYEVRSVLMWLDQRAHKDNKSREEQKKRGRWLQAVRQKQVAEQRARASKKLS